MAREIKDREAKASEYKESLLRISRVSKTVKGGRRISFSVLAAVGDEKGKVGIGLGKANGVPDAIRKAVANAKKNMITVSLKGGTLPHDQIGKYNATSVLLKPASKGNVARATLDGLKKLRSVEEVARLRGKSVEEILG